MTQLILPMPAQPLPPLAIDGHQQAERMAVLAEMAECRRDFAWDVGERRQARARRYNLDVVESNYGRSLRHHADAFREAAAKLQARAA